MASGDTDLAAYRDWLLSLGTSIEETAKEVAQDLEKDVKSTAKAGTTYDGEAWKPNQKGTKPLPGVEDHIKSEAMGNLVVTTLTGVYAYHNNAKDADYRRRVLPETSAGVPARLSALLRKAAQRVWDRRRK